jgi:hypothetical protein
VVPYERQDRGFGFAQIVEQAASPLAAFLISPTAHFVFIPFMTDGAGAQTIGRWLGTGADRSLALVFLLTGDIGLVATLLALSSRPYRLLSDRYLAGVTTDLLARPHGLRLNSGAVPQTGPWAVGRRNFDACRSQCRLLQLSQALDIVVLLPRSPRSPECSTAL